MFGHDNVRMPLQILSDQGKAILMACLQEFNKETMATFLDRAWKTVQVKSSKTSPSLMTPHLCCSHFIKKVSEVSKKICKDNVNRWYTFMMHSASLLVNARTYEDFEKILEDTFLLLLTVKQCAEVELPYARIQKRIDSLNIDEKACCAIKDKNKTLKSQKKEEKANDEEEPASKTQASGPFAMRLCKIVDDTEKRSKKYI